MRIFQLIQKLNINNDNFTIAFDLLDKRFHNKSQILNSL